MFAVFVFGRWEREGEVGGGVENQKHAPMGVLLVFERCRLGGDGEGSRRKPETRPHGRASDLREVESRPTPKTRPCGRVFGVGLEGMGREAGENQKHAPMGVLLVFER